METTTPAVDLCEDDLYTWSERPSALIRQSRFERLDTEKVAAAESGCARSASIARTPA